MTDATGTPQVPESNVAPDPLPASPSKSRRRLLMAAGVALPSICTLGSGAAVAAASNIACFAKQGPPPIRFTTDGDYARRPDGWLRAPVSVGEYDGTPADCIMSQQAECVSTAPGPSQGPASAASPAGVPGTNAQDGSVWIVQGNRVISSRHVPIKNVDSRRKHYGLVYVDETGTVATLDPNGSPNLRAVTNSCWASIMPGTKSHLG